MSTGHVCVIGGGAAGSAMALRLARHHVRVTVIETGPWYTDEEKSRLFEGVKNGTIRGNPYRLKEPSIAAYRSGGSHEIALDADRVRAVGGSTMHWLGNCPRLLPDDFRMHTRFGLAADWPIGYEELEPYYVQAEREIGVAGAGDNPFAGPRSAPYPMPPLPLSYGDKVLKRVTDPLGLDFHHTPQARNSIEYGGRSACQACAYCHVCPTAARATFDATHAAPARATGLVTFITDSTTLRLETDASGRVRRAIYAGLDRTEHALEADLFVVAGGAVETPRLLLLSTNPQFPEGLANRSGLLGKTFMAHPLVRVEGRVADPVFPYRVGFESLESFQHYATDTRDEAGAFLINLSNTEGPTPSGLVRGSWLWGDDLAGAVRRDFGHTLSLVAQMEQLPDQQNTIGLDPDMKDYFGLPVPLVTSGLDEYTRRTRERATRVLGDILQAAGATDIGAAGAGSPGHHMGTTRMGADPARSVVDPYLRAHDVPNLYLVSCGAFVTGGAANPTLTLTALALRTADHIVRAS